MQRATAASTSSPATCPAASLTRLKWSMSTIITTAGVPYRRKRRTWLPTSSCQCRRLASPVWKSDCESCSSSRLRRRTRPVISHATQPRASGYITRNGRHHSMVTRLECGLNAKPPTAQPTRAIAAIEAIARPTSCQPPSTMRSMPISDTNMTVGTRSKPATATQKPARPVSMTRFRCSTRCGRSAPITRWRATQGQIPQQASISTMVAVAAPWSNRAAATPMLPVAKPKLRR